MALGVHHQVNLKQARIRLPLPLALQGNLAPELMESDIRTVQEATKELLDEMRDDPAHVLNLGHGIRPGAHIDCMHALVDTALNYNAD